MGSIINESSRGTEWIRLVLDTTSRRTNWSRIIKKYEGPPYSPWIQGTVERLNQTIKRKLIATMDEQRSQRWSFFVSKVIDEYNNTVHSTIKMKPIEAWNKCWTSDAN